MMSNSNPQDIRILIVDDTLANQALLQSILDRYEFQTLLAANGREALDIIRDHMPDLILLDVMLPDLDGYEVCRRLKADEGLKHIPVIFISALHDQDHIIQAFRAGGVDYVTKPFKHAEIIARVNTHLEIKRLREQDVRLIEQLSQEIQRREKAEREVLSLALARERKNILSQFIQDASHAFKTPLSVIGTSLYVLGRKIEEPAHRQTLETIKVQSELIQVLVEGMVTMSWLDGDPTLESDKIELNQIFRAILLELDDLIANKQLDIHYQIDLEQAMIRGDVSYMMIAFRHLVLNAIRYTPEGGRISIEVQVNQQAGTVTITFADTGIGMSPDQVEQIFDRFYRADEARSINGLGLGLPMAKRIIELHGGTISVESELGAGSCFTVVLPSRMKPSTVPNS